MRTIIGKPERPTPVLSSRITCLEANPYWNIPQTLAREDVLPKLQRDPGYLQQRGIRAFETWRPGAPELDTAAIDWRAIAPEQLAFKLQQVPGPANPLGQVKFLFANPYSVYIHDTPGEYEFSLPDRFFSSGCVRVEEPVRLAQALLGDRYGEFTAALDSGATVSFTLPRPVPVHLVYLTAWVDGAGRPCFRDDVYGVVEEQEEAIAAGTPARNLPGADRARVDVDEPGARVVADAAGPLR